jgi:hypothetical protein
VSATDPDGDDISLSAEDLPSGASFVDNGDNTGTFSWTPGYTQDGEYDVTFIASDGYLEDSCIVHITVYDSGPVPPVAVDDYFEVDEDTVDNPLDVLYNDFDLNGDDLTIIDVTSPTHGEIFNHGTYITYTPDADFFGDDGFSYTISDGNGGTDSADVTIEVLNVNDPPNTPDIPDGPTEGKPGVTYTYTAVTDDIDGDEVAYLFSWGDGTTSGWTQFYPSGKEASATHAWSKQGSYLVTVKAKDDKGLESDYSDPLDVVIPRSRDRSFNTNFILNYLREGNSILDLIRFILSAGNWFTQYLPISYGKI